MITNYVKSVNMGGALEVLRKTGRGAFRTREYAALVGNSGYARVALHRLKNKGEIFLVKRGWWAFPTRRARSHSVQGFGTLLCFLPLCIVFARLDHANPEV